MIKLYRNIRRKLAAENKFMAYTRYAIGETALVVVGILIALQINNWNENRKNNIEAHKILLSLNEDFQANSSLIKYTAHKVQLMSNHTNKLIQIIDKDSLTINPDSLGAYITVGASSWWRDKTVSNTYDALSGSGNINLISNKKLKKLLADFYASTKSGFEDENNLEQLAVKILEKTSKECYILWSNNNKEKDSQLIEKNNTLKNEAIISILNNKDLMGLLLFKHVLEINQQQFLKNLFNLSNEILNEINKTLYSN